LCQRAHLGGHDRKATALFTGSRGLDRRIERQDIGLEGDAVDRADDVADASRRGPDALHRLDDGPHDLTSVGGDRSVSGRHSRCFTCAVGAVPDRRGDLLHGRCRFFKVGSRLLGSC
jgi:hypothetical protein